MPPGVLLIVATPLGNLEDISPRALEALSQAALVACEDTRRTRGLLSRFGIKPPRIISCHKFSERRQAGPILEVLRNGGDVALVSDGGTPGLSDPGALVVEAALAEGLRVSPIPGPSAVAAAVSACGFAAPSFLFAGFLPARSGPRRRALEALADEPRPLVFYEAPHRVAAAVSDMLAALGDRQVTMFRELTKLHEEIVRTTLSGLERRLGEGTARGEFTLVVAGRDASAAPPAVAGSGTLEEQYLALLRDGIDRKEALKLLARRTGIARREIYAAVRGKS